MTLNKLRPFGFLLLLYSTAVLASSAEVVSTRCMVDQVAATPDVRLLGCDPGYASNVLWHLDRLDSSTGTLDGTLVRPSRGKGAVVYVMDTGIEKNHPEFQRGTGSAVVAGLDALTPVLSDSAACPTPDRALHPCYFPPPSPHAVLAHGTAVASVVAGRNTGVAPDAKVVSVLAGGENGTSYRVWLRALDEIVRHAWDPATPQFRTAIVNISGGAPWQQAGVDDVALSDVEQRMRAMIGGVNRNGEPDPNGKRFLFVVAAGNREAPVQRDATQGQCDERGDIRLFPATIADAEGIISVGGITRDNRVWKGSCRGAEILAPAQDLLVAAIPANVNRPGVPERYRSGTSYAVPIVSGVAALLLSEDPALAPAQLESLIEEAASSTGENSGKVVMLARRTTAPPSSTVARVHAPR